MTPEEREAKLRELFTTALSCRAAQRAYYRHRQTEDLIAAKDWERRLDVLLAELEKEEG